ncbi:MAG: T9SS type A sorting domain-containing protein [Rhizobacter sp.]|nr:T9SS type A sorting domain-containing protein [Chlorobiales bacterium]
MNKIYFPAFAPMRFFLTLVMLLVITCKVSAQQIPFQTFSTAGGQSVTSGTRTLHGAFGQSFAGGGVGYGAGFYSFQGTSLMLDVPVFSPTGAGKPQRFELQQNYPNPFNPSTTIAYAVAKGGDVSLKVYDVLGREVMTLVSGRREAGRYAARFDASRFSSGVYFYKFTSAAFTETKKMMLVK